MSCEELWSIKFKLEDYFSGELINERFVPEFDDMLANFVQSNEERESQPAVNVGNVETAQLPIMKMGNKIGQIGKGLFITND